jgi:hypothetical protein
MHFEYAFDVTEFPCDNTVSHIMVTRDPWLREMSLLRKMKKFRNTPQLKLQKSIKELTEALSAQHDGAIHAAQSCSSRKCDNRYIRFLLGSAVAENIRFGGIAAEHLKAAKQIVDQIDVVIDTDKIGHASTLGRIQNRIGPYFDLGAETDKNMLGTRHNTHPRPILSAEVQGLLATLRQLFIKFHALDFKLFEYMLEIQANQILAYNESAYRHLR